MDPTDTLRRVLRGNLEERIPPGGSQTDTLFANDEIDELLIDSGSIEEASWRGWLRKGLRVLQPGTLVSANMGSETFKFQDPAALQKIAQGQADYWYGLIPPGDVPASVVPGSRVIEVAGPVLPGINAPATDGLSWRSIRLSGDASRLWGDL